MAATSVVAVGTSAVVSGEVAKTVTVVVIMLHVPVAPASVGTVAVLGGVTSVAVSATLVLDTSAAVEEPESGPEPEPESVEAGAGSAVEADSVPVAVAAVVEETAAAVVLLRTGHCLVDPDPEEAAAELDTANTFVDNGRVEGTLEVVPDEESDPGMHCA